MSRPSLIQAFYPSIWDLKVFVSIALLVLLSLSFIIENRILCEGESIELLEGSEKEKEKDKDKKEKKLLFADLHPALLKGDVLWINSLIFQHLLSPFEINLEVQTPPPEQYSAHI